MKYAIDNQKLRRNLTDAELVRCVEAVDKRNRKGAEPGCKGNQSTANEASCDASLGTPTVGHMKSAAVTAKIVGISASKVERTRSILDFAETDPVQSNRPANSHVTSDQIPVDAANTPLLAVRAWGGSPTLAPMKSIQSLITISSINNKRGKDSLPEAITPLRAYGSCRCAAQA